MLNSSQICAEASQILQRYIDFKYGGGGSKPPPQVLEGYTFFILYIIGKTYDERENKTRTSRSFKVSN